MPWDILHDRSREVTSMLERMDDSDQLTRYTLQENQMHVRWGRWQGSQDSLSRNPWPLILALIEDGWLFFVSWKDQMMKERERERETWVRNDWATRRVSKHMSDTLEKFHQQVSVKRHDQYNLVLKKRRDKRRTSSMKRKVLFDQKRDVIPFLVAFEWWLGKRERETSISFDYHSLECLFIP